ncbi:hypothetical protein TrVE_jg11691 [Triparma verrucosa]|nr:hypothetical protein TrST_g62 [Triparma strigata]GMH93998.1 hypothetical protein TrVE_jg11691 [Triparma verrucosa]
MGLDVKEKNLLKFLGTTFLPPVIIFPYLSRTFFPSNNLGFLGFLTLTYLLYISIFQHVLYFLKTRILFKTDLKKYGEWAVVTGGTSGIGMEFVHTFGRKGINVIVVSRSVEKMEKLKEDFESKYSVKCKYVQYDFNNTDATVLSSFKKSFNDVVKSCSSVGILINNVGLSNETPEYLHLIPESDINQMLTVNNFGTILMSRLLLPHFVERKKGALVTVSSASCTHATPLLSCYSATKGFGNQLTRSMFYEYKEFGVDCLSITPYYFVSNMFKRSRSTYLAPFPSSIVEPCLLALGHVPECYPYWGHYMMGTIAWFYWKTEEGLLGIMKKNKARAEAKMKKK